MKTILKPESCPPGRQLLARHEACVIPPEYRHVRLLEHLLHGADALENRRRYEGLLIALGRSALEVQRHRMPGLIQVLGRRLPCSLKGRRKWRQLACLIQAAVIGAGLWWLLLFLHHLIVGWLRQLIYSLLHLFLLQCLEFRLFWLQLGLFNILCLVRLCGWPALNGRHLYSLGIAGLPVELLVQRSDLWQGGLSFGGDLIESWRCRRWVLICWLAYLDFWLQIRKIIKFLLPWV